MAMTSIGDLAQSYFLQLRGAKLKTEQNRLTQELATGQVSDVKKRLAGNVSYLSGIEADIKALDAYAIVTTEAQQFTTAVQSALNRVQTATGDIANAVLRVGPSTVHSLVKQIATDARTELANTVSALNDDLAGRSLFAGAATNVAPLASAETILAQVRAIAAAAPSRDQIITDVQAWFDDPAGFDAVIYQGSNDDLPAFHVNAETTLGNPIRADDAEIKDVLMNMALVALSTDPVIGLDEAGQRDLIKSAGEGLLVAQGVVTRLQGNTGFVQQRIEQAAVRNSAELTTLQYTKGSFLEANPYETATNLENVQFQLQSLYTVTVRMSDLSLGNFLR